MTWGPTSIKTSSRTLGMFKVKVGVSAANIAIATPVLNDTNSLGAMASTKYAGTSEFHPLQSGYPKRTDGKIPLSTTARIECAYKELTPYNFALAHGLSPFESVSSVVSEVSVNTTLGTTVGNITVTDNDGPVTDTWIVTFTGATAGVIAGIATGHVHNFSAVDSSMAPVNPGSTGGTIPYFTIPADFFSGTWAADDTYIFSTGQYVGGTTLYDNQFSGSIGLGSLSAPEYVRVEATLTFPKEENAITFILPRAQAAAAVEFDAGDDEVNVPINFEGTSADSSVDGGSSVWNYNKATGVGPLGRIYWSSI